MKRYSTHEFSSGISNALANSPDWEESKTLFIHSSLFSLGRLSDVAPHDYPSALYEALQTSTGCDATICMPTFNYQFPKSRCEDLTTQQSELGAWPNWFLQNVATARSAHPIFSIAASGPNAHNICQPDTPEPNAFNADSTFGRLHRANTTLLFIGIDIRVATFVVYCEAMCQLRYRFLKPFRGELTLHNGKVVNQDFFHFCFPLNNAYRENYDTLYEHLCATNAIKIISLGNSFIFSLTMNQLFTAVERLTSINKHALLNCEPKHYYHYLDGKETTYEID